MTDAANPARVSGAAFHGDLAAIAAFYRWLEERRGATSPVLRRELRRSGYAYTAGVPRSEVAAAPAGVRDRNVKWLDPAAVRRWVDMGLRGLDCDGREEPGTRNRTGTRDAAFAELLYGSGLRVSVLAAWGAAR
jgi:site-specific recombinase XerC